ncbi:NlpC/P60 family protein [Sphingomonas sp. ac-8]|uniref:NlpC/P60 family protein n=1 Tax=Sphingomonas sp. ac-8 TaxID=3242977 RepID=UPI003A808A74
MPEGRPRSRFSLAGRSSILDTRVDAVRRDLADIRLAERVFAPHYALSQPRTAGRNTPVLARAGEPETVLSEVLAGESFDVLEVSGDYLWGVSPIDGSVGFVAADAFTAFWTPTHIVAVRTAMVHGRASLDSATLAALPMGTCVAASPAGESLCEVDGGYVGSDALMPLGGLSSDVAAIAEQLVGVPARAGGRSGAGLDAAGLVFLSLHLAGKSAPRFCDLQAATVGTACSDADPFERGQVLFFDDHAAILVDAQTAVHVDADSVVRSPVAALTDRYGAILGRRQP